MMEGTNSPRLCIALEGLGRRYKTLLSGDQRVINLVLPGDFVGLQAAVMTERQHCAKAVKLGQVSVMPLPCRQQDVADALGMSVVHSNKRLRKLRDRTLANWRDDRPPRRPLP